jgi:GxxExxY protein
MPRIHHPEHDELTYASNGAAMRVRARKGPGMLEHAYHKFLCHELRKLDFEIQSQQLLPAKYDELIVQDAYRPDIIVNRTIIVEVKAVQTLLSVHRAQLVTYLTESALRTGLLINFNAVPFKDGIRRISI